MRRLINPVQPIRHFRDEQVTPVRRRWMCAEGGCDGEMRSSGKGFTTMSTSWHHACDKCGREEWADYTYPHIAWLPSEALDAADSQS